MKQIGQTSEFGICAFFNFDERILVAAENTHLYFYTVSQKSSHLLTVCNFVKSQPIFKIFAPLESVRNLLQNPYDITQLTLAMLLHCLGKLKIQILCRCRRKRKQIAFFNCLLLRYSSTNCDTFGVENSESFPVLIANKTFHVTILLLIYFYNQFLAPEIRHSRRQCSACQQSTWYSATRTIF